MHQDVTTREDALVDDPSLMERKCWGVLPTGTAKMGDEEVLPVSFTLTETAARWFMREMQLQPGDHVKFYVRYGGMNGPGNGFSLGVRAADPVHMGEKVVIDGITFFMEQDDLWYLEDHHVTIKHNEQTDDIEYVYRKAV